MIEETYYTVYARVVTGFRKAHPGDKYLRNRDGYLLNCKVLDSIQVDTIDEARDAVERLKGASYEFVKGSVIETQTSKVPADIIDMAEKLHSYLEDAYIDDFFEEEGEETLAEDVAEFVRGAKRGVQIKRFNEILKFERGEIPEHLCAYCGRTHRARDKECYDAELRNLVEWYKEQGGKPWAT